MHTAEPRTTQPAEMSTFTICSRWNADLVLYTGEHTDLRAVIVIVRPCSRTVT